MAPSAQTKKLILDGSLFVLSQVAFYYAFKVRLIAVVNVALPLSAG
jgi:hypothetical protein